MAKNDSAPVRPPRAPPMVSTAQVARRELLSAYETWLVILLRREDRSDRLRDLLEWQKDPTVQLTAEELDELAQLLTERHRLLDERSGVQVPVVSPSRVTIAAREGDFARQLRGLEDSGAVRPPAGWRIEDFLEAAEDAAR